MEEYGVNVHPHIATVTYLHANQRTAPTIVFPQAVAPTSVGEDFSQTCDSIFIAYPSEGKHMSFDGRLLHAAPHDLSPPTAIAKRSNGGGKKTKRNKRVTFLVNIWLNHFPLTAQVLGKEQIQAMKCVTWKTLDWECEETVKKIKAPAECVGLGVELDFVVENRKASAFIELSQKNYSWQKSDLGVSLMVDMTEKKICIKRGEEVVSGDEEEEDDSDESDSYSDSEITDDEDSSAETAGPKKKKVKGTN
jgi:hypothetical protein